MIAVLNLLQMGGGSEPDSPVDLTVNADKDLYFADELAGTKVTIYVSSNDNRKMVIDWSNWLNGQTIASVSWTPSNTGILPTPGNQTNSNTTTTAYLNPSDNQTDSEVRVDVKVTADSSVARITERSFMVNVVRRWV